MQSSSLPTDVGDRPTFNALALLIRMLGLSLQVNSGAMLEEAYQDYNLQTSMSPMRAYTCIIYKFIQYVQPSKNP